MVALFNQLDQDGDGELSSDELKQLGSVTHVNLSERQLEDACAEMDVDNDKHVNLDDWHGCLKRLHYERGDPFIFAMFDLFRANMGKSKPKKWRS